MSSKIKYHMYNYNRKKCGIEKKASTRNTAYFVIKNVRTQRKAYKKLHNANSF